MPEITIDIDAEEEVDFFPEIPEDEELEIELPEFFDNNKLSVGGESSHKRDRTISESVRMKSLPKSPSRSDMMMKRNRSTPGLGRLARLDSINDQREVMKVLDSYNNRRNSSYLVYEVQHGSQQVLKPSVSRRNSKAIIRPMSRKDIFYSGSVYNLALDMSEEKGITNNSLKGYRHSIVSIPRNGSFAHRGSVVACHLSIPSEEILDPELLKEKIETTNPIMNVLKEMLDFDIMLNPLFALICISNIFGFLAVYVPYVYLPNMTHQRGISSESAAFIISLIGVSNTIGRVIIGAFVDLPWVSSLVVTNISLIMSGVCLFIFPFCYDYTSFSMVALMLGLFVSAFISLTSIVLVDLLGLDSLTSSFGMLVLCRGIASILGPPLAGLVFDWSQDYSASFYMAGGFFVFGGILSFIAYFMDRQRQRNIRSKN